MFEIFKQHFNKIFQVIVYTTLLCLIYGIWSWTAWNLWFVTMIIVLAIVAAGTVVGYFWIKSQIKSETTVENNQ